MMIPIRRALKYFGLAVVALVVLVGAGLLTGFLGVPAVESVENRFADVDRSTTTVDTNVTVANPNPLGLAAGDLRIDYGLAMNGVALANGSKEGLSVEAGRSTVPFRTTIANERIPDWWYTHVNRSETSDVVVDVDLSHGLLGGRTVSLPQERTVETDILGQFNNSTTRPIDADAPLVSDPVLYVNETTATYGENVTPQRTPLDLAFTVYNPKLYPYSVSEIGYEIRMNDVDVGAGSSAQSYTIPPRSTRTIEANVVIDNENIDDWWVSHLARDQVTDVTIDVAVLVDPNEGGMFDREVRPIRIDTAAFDYETTIETDIFGTKASDGLPPEDGITSGSADSDGSSGSDGSTGDGTESDPNTESSSDTPTTETSEPTPDETETDDATATDPIADTPTETDDGGGLLG